MFQQTRRERDDGKHSSKPKGNREYRFNGAYASGSEYAEVLGIALVESLSGCCKASCRNADPRGDAQVARQSQEDETCEADGGSEMGECMELGCMELDCMEFLDYAFDNG